MLFQDRKDAGGRLAQALKELHLEKPAIVLGLPRGGVVVGAIVAKTLGLPLDIIAPRKIGAPGNPELAIGAIAGDEIVCREGLADKAYLEREIAQEKKEAERRLSLYRQGRNPLSLQKKTVILVDDGIATGATMIVSVRSVLKQGAKRCIAAAPVAPPETIEKLRREGAEPVVLYTPSPFFAVAQFYNSFPQTEDSEVISLLSHSAEEG